MKGKAGELGGLARIGGVGTGGGEKRIGGFCGPEAPRTQGGSGEAALVEGDEFFHAAVELLGVGGGFGDAVADVVFQELRFQAAEGGMDGGDGVEDFRAIAVLRDHAADALDLPGDAVDAAEERGGFVAGAIHEYTYRGYMYGCKWNFRDRGGWRGS